MSSENVDVVQRGLEAYFRRDVQGLCDVADEQCELFTFTEGVAEAKPFRGHAGIAAWLHQEMDPWDEFRVQPTGLREVGDRVLVRTAVTARGKGSSIELTADSGLVFEVRRGKIACVRSYLDWREALSAVGLPE